jgi:fructose-bisphosphate aldolase class I
MLGPSPEKAKAEALLKAAIVEKLNELPEGQLAMLKLTPPEQDDLYADGVSHPNVVRVAALSGGYAREEANNRLRRSHGIVASFSRALVEGLYRLSNSIRSSTPCWMHPFRVSLRRPTPKLGHKDH